ncbi:MAG: hypothetical protein J6B87_00060 [Clostridia bacterium]|nr:hypothetical protein [Clostridia bacterium]
MCQNEITLCIPNADHYVLKIIKDTLGTNPPYPCVNVYQAGYFICRIRLDNLIFENEDSNALCDEEKQMILAAVCKYQKLLIAFHEAC